MRWTDVCVVQKHSFLLESKGRFRLKLLEIQHLYHLSLDASHHCTGALLVKGLIKIIKKKVSLVSSDLCRAGRANTPVPPSLIRRVVKCARRVFITLIVAGVDFHVAVKQ